MATMTTARADEWDKKTNITVNETILIPGRTLPPGKYVMKLANITANRHVVQIFNEDQDKLEATILAFNNHRIQQTGKTVLTYWETPAGSPPALRGWFWPGDTWGQEFAYPKEMAEKLSAQNNNAKVASYEASAALTPEQATNLQVRDAEDSSSNVAAAPAPAPTPEREQVAQATPPREATPAPAPVTQAPPAPAADNTLLAQNTPPPSPATDAEPTELPQTASPMPWVLAIGLVSLLSAAALKATNRA
jgi:hypothetical protein